MIKRKYHYKGEQHTVQCDCCGKSSKQVNHPTAGDAADSARNEGFKTVFLDVIYPAYWACPDCHSTNKKPSTEYLKLLTQELE